MAPLIEVEIGARPTEAQIFQAKCASALELLAARIPEHDLADYARAGEPAQLALVALRAAHGMYSLAMLAIENACAEVCR